MEPTNDCKCKCVITNDNRITCQIPKAADFMTLQSINLDAGNIEKVRLLSFNNVLWEGNSFREAAELAIPICEPLLFCAVLTLEFYLKNTLAKEKDNVFVHFALRYDKKERERRYANSENI